MKPHFVLASPRSLFMACDAPQPRSAGAGGVQFRHQTPQDVDGDTHWPRQAFVEDAALKFNPKPDRYSKPETLYPKPFRVVRETPTS